MASIQSNISPPDGSWHGVIQEGTAFEPKSGRYHLYVGLFCPFAHRAYLVRYLKGLTSLISVSIVKPYPKGDDKGWPGWCFPKDDQEYPGATTDKLFGSDYLHEVYFKANKEYKGRYSVPVLWDTEADTIVNNESHEIMHFLQTAFDPLLSEEYKSRNYYPADLRPKIDEICEWMQQDLNTGVYKAGFATSQELYDKNLPAVFDSLNKLEKIISESGGPYILIDRLTEVDLRLYPTLIRFDTVYVQHFKCNLGTIRHDYPFLNNWMKNLYWNVPGFKETTNFKHIKEAYTKSHPDINPHAITPMGPVPDIEKGVEEDLMKLRVGHVDIPTLEAHL